MYKKVVYRQLHGIRDEEMLEKLEMFVKEAYGKKYSLNARKLLTRKSMAVKGSDSLIEKNRTFFCSELVAKAYKCMGLLDKDKSSSTYFPNSFSSEKKLALLKGLSLGPELVVYEVGDEEAPEGTK